MPFPGLKEYISISQCTIRFSRTVLINSNVWWGSITILCLSFHDWMGFLQHCILLPVEISFLLYHFFPCLPWCIPLLQITFTWHFTYHSSYALQVCIGAVSFAHASDSSYISFIGLICSPCSDILTLCIKHSVLTLFLSWAFNYSFLVLSPCNMLHTICHSLSERISLLPVKVKYSWNFSTMLLLGLLYF